MKRTLFLMLAVLLSALSASASYDFEVNYIGYKLANDNAYNKDVYVVFCNTNSYNNRGYVTIPSKVKYSGKTYNVIRIDSEAFQNDWFLTSISIPSSITSIGGSAFSGCTNLTSVTFNAENCASPSSESDRWFKDCPLTSLVIGDDVKSIPEYIAYNQTKLKNVTIPKFVTSIGDHAFDGCTGLTSISFLSRIPEYESYSLTKIGRSAFDGCTGLTSVTIPNSVTSIGGSAFKGCIGLNSITIPYSVTSIGGSAFYSCTGLTSVTIGESVTYIAYDAFYGCTGLTSVTFNAKNCVSAYWDNALSRSWFRDCPLTSLVIGDDVKSIPEYIAYNLTTLKKVTIGNSVTKIGGSAFDGCTGLTSVTIPNSVTKIDGGAFSGCTGLTSVTIPNSVTSINNNAFGGCTGLTSVTFNAANCKSPDSYNYAFFRDCPLTGLVIGDDVKSIPGYIALNQTKLKTVSIPNSVTRIGNGAFWGCTGLTSVTIPNSVTEIGYKAFTYCTGLTSVTIGNSVTTIGRKAFAGCTGLTSVTIPNSVTSIGFRAFEGTPWYNNQPDGVVYIGKVAYKFKGEMASGTAINIKEGTVSIGPEAFTGCTGLTSVTIPNSVTTIGDDAFSKCTGLTSVSIGNSVTTIGVWAFAGCTGLTSVTIPNSVTTIGGGTFSGCKGLTSVIIPNSVTSIGGDAFAGCTGLTSVTIPNSVTSIGDHAFWNCTGLPSVTIPNSVNTIGDMAFWGCTGLTSVTIPNSVNTIGDRAFEYCTGLKKIYSLNPVPPVIRDHTFYPYNADLFVPKRCVPKYKNAEYWRNFKFIGEIEEEGGIDDVIGADSKIKYDGGTITISVPSEIAVYSIDGRLVATANGVSLDTESLTHGTYVVRAADAHGNVQTLKFIK